MSPPLSPLLPAPPADQLVRIGRARAELATAAELTSWSPAGSSPRSTLPQIFKYPKPVARARGERVRCLRAWVSVSVAQSVLSVSDDSDNNTL